MREKMFSLLILVSAVAGFCDGGNVKGNNEAPRIIGGRDAKEGEFKFPAALYYKGSFICTSSLVSAQYILTAAHCVVLNDTAQKAEYYSAILGHVDRSNPEFNVTFASITPHERYNPRSSSNDIALMKLSSRVNVMGSIQPICIPKPNKVFDNKRALAIGWGKTENGSYPLILQVAEADVTTLQYCKLVYCFLTFCQVKIDESQVCAGTQRKGACNGDSGGPLVMTTSSGERSTIGVTSFVTAFGCALPSVPTVYSSTSSYSDWIVKNTNSTVCVI